MRMRRIMAFVTVLCVIALLTLTLAGCGLLGGEYTYHKLSDGTVKITKYNGKAETLEVPGELGGKTVTGIGDYAFSDCVRLRSVSLPDSVTSIGKMAFFSCRYLTSVTLPEGLKTIGDSAFNGCEMLTSVVIPYGVTDIGGYVFAGCKALTSVTVPGSVKNMGEYIFKVAQADNPFLTRYPDGLTVIVPQYSYAEEYCRENGLKYVYPEA